MDLKLKGQLAIVTGSTAGIGKAIAKSLLAEGARVVINGRDKDKVKAVSDELRPFGETIPGPGDLSTLEGANELIKTADSAGEVQILVNNLGQYESKPFDETPDEDWMYFFNVNVMSAVRTARHYLPKMLKANYGRIINVSSECGFKPLPLLIHYSVTKTAMLGLTRSLAELTKGTCVTVNSILPGLTYTESTAEYQCGIAASQNKTMEQHVKDYFKEYDPTSLLQRFATVEEVANTVTYYCSSLSAATNGASIRVEGGVIRSI